MTDGLPSSVDVLPRCRRLKRTRNSLLRDADYLSKWIGCINTAAFSVTNWTVSKL